MASETFASFSCVSHAVADQNFFNILYAWPETRRLLYALPAEWNFAAQVTYWKDWPGGVAEADRASRGTAHGLRSRLVSMACGTTIR